MPLVTNFTALISGASINGRIGLGAFATFSFPTASPVYLNSQFPQIGLATFQPFSDAYKVLARQAINAYGAASGLTFFEAPPGQGDIQFMIYNTALLGNASSGFAYFPTNVDSDIASDIFIDRTATSNDTNLYLLVHELSHALGLKHGFEGDVRFAPEVDRGTNSVLSSQFINGFSGGPGPFDIQAMQYLYGGPDQDGTQVTAWSWDPATFQLTQFGNDLSETIGGVGTRDVIVAGGGDDTVYGRGGDDDLSGGAGADFISGGSGNDALDGGDGNDRLNGDADNDTLVGGAGNDNLSGGPGDDFFDGGIGADSITTGEGFDRVVAGDGDDSINVTIAGPQFRLNVDGGAGNDGVTIAAAGFTGDTISFAEAAANAFLLGVERITLSGPVDRAISVIGTELGETISLFGPGNVAGNGGNDVFNGSKAADIFLGGAGADTANASDGADQLFGEQGDDRLLGDAGDDVLEGGEGNDNLTGGAGADRLDGGAQNDTLVGDEFDSFIGGDGNDQLTAVIGSAVRRIVMDGGTGHDNALITLQSGAGPASAEAFNLTNVENLILRGSSSADQISTAGVIESIRIEGGAGDDLLIGSDNPGFPSNLLGDAGADILIAGIRTETFRGGADADRFVFGPGTTGVTFRDTVADFQSGVDRLDLSPLRLTDVIISPGGTIFPVGGDDPAFNLLVLGPITLGDILLVSPDRFGTFGADRLTGDGQVNILYALGGDDILDGGGGPDQSHGGPGNDIFFSDAVGDLTIEAAGEGSDALYALSDVVLPTDSEVELIVFAGISATGSNTGNQIVGNARDNLISGLAGNDYFQGGAGDDTILGGAGIDYLDGEGGADRMEGGADGDVYVVDHAADSVIEAAGEGYDRLYTSVSFAFAATSEIDFAVLTGTALGMTGSNTANHLVGNGLDNVLIGLDGADYLQGESGADRLFGDAGNDFFDGGAGADIMLGGLGDDIFLVDNAGDDVRETAGQGFDRVFSGTDVFLGLPSEIEFVRLTGAAVVAGGSDTANQIVGTGAANLINGYAGDDYLQAEDGDDFLLGAAGADYLDGGVGADRMDGGFGDDTFIVENLGDQVVEAVGGGFDRVFASANLTLAVDSEVEVAILTGAATIATGSDTANRLIGTASDSLLVGRGGADQLEGGGGDDLLDGGAGADVLDGGTGFDSARFAGVSGDYRVTRFGDGYLIRDLNVADGDEGEDRLASVERLAFSNGAFLTDSLVSNQTGAMLMRVAIEPPASEMSFPTGEWGYMIA